MIKHFGVYPIGMNKDNLFEEQKIFLIYLMGLTPTQEDWSVQMDYKSKKAEIEELETVELGKTDIDLATMQGKNLEDLKKERLSQEKERKLKELNDDFGIKEEPEEIEIEGLPEIENKEENPDKNHQQLWDVLNGKGLLKKDG